MKPLRQLARILPLTVWLAPVACSSDYLPSTGGDNGGTGQSGSGGSSAGVSGTSSGGAAGVGVSGTGGAGPAGASSGGAGAVAGSASGGGAGVAPLGGSGGTAGTPAAGGAGASSGGASGGAASGTAGQVGGGRGGAMSGGAGGQSGGRGGAATGGTGGGGAFAPCPATGKCVILPLGDSITDGVGVTGGGSYRIELFHRTLTDNKQITYVGSLVNGPQMVDGQPFPRNHEGHSGWRIDQIDGIVPSPALNMDPHIVLLHIGTNDIAQNQASG